MKNNDEVEKNRIFFYFLAGFILIPSAISILISFFAWITNNQMWLAIGSPNWVAVVMLISIPVFVLIERKKYMLLGFKCFISIVIIIFLVQIIGCCLAVRNIWGRK